MRMRSRLSADVRVRVVCEMQYTGVDAGRIHRFYVRHSRLPFGEDRTHEFKGHRNLANEEVPRRLLRSRRAVSRYPAMHASCCSFSAAFMLH